MGRKIGRSEIIKRQTFCADQLFCTDFEEATNIKNGEQNQGRKRLEVARLKKMCDIRPIVKQGDRIDLIFVERHLFEGCRELRFFFEAKGLWFRLAQDFSQGLCII